MTIKQVYIREKGIGCHRRDQGGEKGVKMSEKGIRKGNKGLNAPRGGSNSLQR